MTIRTPTYLRGRFENGDRPNATDYGDVFDSFLSLATSAEQSIDSNLRTTKELSAVTVSATTLRGNLVASEVSASTVISSPLINATLINTSVLNTALVSAVAIGATNLVATSATFTNLIATNISADSLTVSALKFNMLNVSANSTTQAGATLIGGAMSFIVFADGGNDSVRLPPSTQGRVQVVINAASTVVKLYPATSGRFLVTAVNASLNIPADKSALVFHKGDDRYGAIIGGF